MTTYQEDWLRRIAQFAYIFKAMEDRARFEGHSDHYLILSERPRPSADDDVGLVKSNNGVIPVESPCPMLAEADGHDFVTMSGSYKNPAIFGHNLLASEITPPPVSETSSFRFVQFIFKQRSFAMDLPKTTVLPPEIERLSRERRGFAHEAMVGRSLRKREHVRLFDPLGKEYLYGDEQSAADDTAYIFFDLWRFPVDSRLFAEAAAFDGTHRWEQGYPIE